jgi:hypothetical protein
MGLVVIVNPLLRFLVSAALLFHEKRTFFFQKNAQKYTFSVPIRITGISISVPVF